MKIFYFTRVLFDRKIIIVFTKGMRNFYLLLRHLKPTKGPLNVCKKGNPTPIEVKLATLIKLS